MIALGDKDISNLMLGNTQVTKVMLGEEQVYPFQVIHYESLVIKANADSTIGLARLSPNQTLEYSLDNEEWATFNTSISINLNCDDKMYIRGILNNNNSSAQFTQFKITGDVRLDGDMRYVWNYENPEAPLYNYCGFYMFKGCVGITSVSDKLLPPTTLAYTCYSSMFRDCIFLTKAPKLPATTLENFCYEGMFEGCISLQKAPELPATTLADNCYQYIFYGCSKLNYIKCLAEDISSNNCTNGWVSGVAKEGTFVKSPNMNSWTINNSSTYSGIPSGWTIIDADK